MEDSSGNATIPQGAGGSTTPSGSPQPSAAELAELSELRAYRQQTESWAQQHRPFIEALGDETQSARMRRLLEDPEAARVYDDTLAAFEDAKKRHGPKLPPEWDPDQNPFLKRLAGVADYVDHLRKREDAYSTEQQQAANQKVVIEAAAVAQELIDKMPMLAENDYRGVKTIAAYSRSLNIPFRQAADELMPLFRAEEKRVRTPPASLRPNQGASGVPGRSNEQPNMEKPQYDLILDAIKRNRKAG